MPLLKYPLLWGCSFIKIEWWYLGSPVKKQNTSPLGLEINKQI
jgi:hypothetical protein